MILFRVNFLIFPLTATWTTYPIVCKLCNSDEFSVPPQQVALFWLFRLFKFKIIWTLLASGFFNLLRLFEFEIIWVLFVSSFFHLARLFEFEIIYVFSLSVVSVAAKPSFPLVDMHP